MRRGFSLVELSIVLVILGLLTGGILAGQSLIRAAELRSVTADANKYTTATMAFRDRYFGLPGDLSNATSIWGTATTCPGDYTHYALTTATCNGDGDASITASTSSGERFRFWQHLANAGLIEGAYAGVDGSAATTNDAIPGFNVPKAKLSGGGFGVSMGPNPGSATNVTSNMREHLVFGAMSSGSQPTGALLKPEEAWNLDTKMDDGNPGAGKVVPASWPNCTNMATSNDTSSGYKLTDSTPQCALRIAL